MAEFEAADGGETEAQWREFLAYLFAQVSRGKAATAVFAGLAVSQTTTASAAVNVQSGLGIVQASTSGGVSPMVNDTDPKVLDILTGNPMGGLPRNDIVVFDQVTKSIKVIPGTPNASPTDPTVPTSALPLARVRNAASATTIPSSAIDDLRTFTVLNGVKPTATLASRSTDFALSGAGALSAALLTCPMPAVDGNTRVRVVCFVPGFSSTVANDRVEVFLYDGSGTQCGAGYVQVNVGVSNASTFVGQIAAPCPTGNVTMKAQRVAGSGVCTLRGVEGWTLEVIPA